MKTFKRIVGYIGPYWPQFALGLICLLLAQPMQLLHPLF